jgi:hypothetical protein
VSRKILIHSLRSPTHAICHPPSLLLTGCTFSYSFCSRCCSCSSIIRSRFIRCRSASRITPSCIFCNQQSWRMWGVRLFQTLDSDGQSRLLSSWRWLRQRELLGTLGTWAGLRRPLLFDDGRTDDRRRSADPDFVARGTFRFFSGIHKALFAFTSI